MVHQQYSQIRLCLLSQFLSPGSYLACIFPTPIHKFERPVFTSSFSSLALLYTQKESACFPLREMCSWQGWIRGSRTLGSLWSSGDVSRDTEQGAREKKSHWLPSLGVWIQGSTSKQKTAWVWGYVIKAFVSVNCYLWCLIKIST